MLPKLFMVNGRGKFGGWFGAKQSGLRSTKKALQILDLQAIENRLCCLKSPLLYQLS